MADEAEPDPIAADQQPAAHISEPVMDADWLAALGIAAAEIRRAELGRIIPASEIPFEGVFIAAGITGVRHCMWITDTTGDAVRRCGEPIYDGPDQCERYRLPYAETLLGEPLRPPMPFGPFPTAPPEDSGPIVAVIAAPARGEHCAPRF